MSGPWEDFGGSDAAPWEDFAQKKPAPIGAAAFPDFLKQELANADWGTRQIAGFGTAASNAWEALKQFVGKGDAQRVEANKIIEKAAPVGAIAGNVAMTAIPFGVAGNSVATAAKVGAGLGALNPVEGETVWSKEGVADKLKSIGSSAVLSAGGQAAANQAGKWIAGKAANLADDAAANSTRTGTVNNALDAGLGVTPSEVDPTWWTNMLESFGGKAATGKAQSASNAERIPALIREDLHLPPTAPLNGETMQTARDTAYAVGYKPVADLPAINWDPEFVKEITKLSPASAGGAVKNPAQGPIDDLLASLTNRGQWTGEQLVRDIRELRKQASDNFRASGMPGGNPGAQDLAHVQQRAADALEGMAQRAITRQGGSPDALQLMREARQYIARTHSAEDALIAGSDMADPRVLARMADKGRPLSGNMETIGKAANVFPRSFQDPTRATGADVSVVNTMIGAALGGGAGELADHGYMGAMAGPLALALARKGARSAVLSKASQNRLRDVYRLGLASRGAAGALQYAPVAGAVLGREAFSQ